MRNLLLLSANIAAIILCKVEYELFAKYGQTLLASLSLLADSWNYSEANLSKLQAVQNFACRIVNGARKYDHVTPILKQLRWLPVRQQLFYRDAIMAFKCMTGRAPEYLSEKFIKRCEVTSRKTRNSQMLNIPLFRTSSGQRTFYYRTVTLWNSLQQELKLCKSVSQFKCSLRRKLLSNFLAD